MTAPTTPPGPLIILETCLYVDDLQSAEAFYIDVLGLEFVSRRDGRHLFLRIGSGMLLLFLPTASSTPTAGVPPHGAVGPGHVAFHIPQEELDHWQAYLEQGGVAIEQTVIWPGGTRSLYFRDPAGNSLELASVQLWSQ